MNIIALIIAFIVALIASNGTSWAQEKRPNILLVMVDDMGWTDIGSFGSEISTPNLDELAAMGLKFTDFHVSVSCSPTRSMLLTGNDNHIAGLGNMGEMLTPAQRGKPGYEGYLNKNVVTLAEVLRDGGYHTYMSGKWHLGHSADAYPHARGFDRSFSSLFGGASYWSDKFGLLAEVEEVAEYVIDEQLQENLPKDFYATRSFTDFLIGAIRDDHGDGKPFFGYLAFTAPHDPMHVPEPWLSMYEGAYEAGYETLKANRAETARMMGLVPKTAKTSERFKGIRPWNSLSLDEQALEARGMEVYAGMISNMDYHFGRVVNFLKDIGEYENTIILFLSDNGPNPWSSTDYPGNEGSEWFSQFDNGLENIGHPLSHYAYGIGWGAASAGPLNLFKMTVAEGGIRSPLLVAGPGITANKQSDAFAYVWDLMPTLMEMADVDYPEVRDGRAIAPMRGKSLVNLLKGRADHVYGEEDIVAGEMQDGKWVRQGQIKAVSVVAPYGQATWSLYDLQADPGETTDLSDKMPETLKTLQAAWEAYAKDVGVVPMH